MSANMRKSIIRAASILASSAAIFSAPSVAALLDLNGVGYVQYGDAHSYSLPVTALQDGCTSPGCRFYVQSTPGIIQNMIVIATGSTGSGVVTNFSGMDNAYATPATNSTTYFAPSPANSQGSTGTILNNGANTFDMSLSALRTYLAGDQLMLMLNNNQTKSGGASAQSMAAWTQITVKDPSGTVIGAYDLANKSVNGPGGGYNLVTEGGGGAFRGNVRNYTATAGIGPVAGSATSTDYVLSGGALCVATSGGALIPVRCGTAGASAPIDANLGADQVAYAIIFPELTTQLNNLFASPVNLSQYTMSIDVRLGCDPVLSPNTTVCLGGSSAGSTLYGRNLNNGYEQVFISTAAPFGGGGSPIAGVVPEPGTLVLAGSALLGWACMRRRARPGGSVSRATSARIPADRTR